MSKNTSPEKTTLIYSRKHSTCGDACWWRPDGKGYTTDLNQAGRYTKEKADSCCRSTHGDNVPVPESAALSLEARRTVYRRDIEAMLAMCSIKNIHVPSRQTGKSALAKFIQEFLQLRSKSTPVNPENHANPV